VIADRRTIATIGGRAGLGAAGGVPLAARPALVRALTEAALVVATAGVICAGLVQLGDRAPRALAATAPPTGAAAATTALDPEAAPAVAEPATAPSTTAVSPATAAPIRASAASPSPARSFPVEVLASESLKARAPGSVEGVIATVFGHHARAAIKVARCESSLRPGAVSAGRGNWGLFQINRIHEDLVVSMGFAWEDLLDARVNALVAREIYDAAGGWSPWDCAWAAR
jgi:hypothetical protein